MVIQYLYLGLHNLEPAVSFTAGVLVVLIGAKAMIPILKPHIVLLLKQPKSR